MASFVESATLRLIDESSGKIRRINSELSKLFATARKGKRIRIDIDGLDKASAQARKLHADMSRLSRPVRLRVDAAGLNKVVNDLARLPRQKTVRINVVQNGIVPNVPQGVGQNTTRGFVPRRHRGFVGAGFGGIGVGLSGFSPVGAGVTALAFGGARSAGRATVAAAAEDTIQRNLGFTANELEALARSARNASGAQLLLTETDKRAIARNLYNAGVQGDALNALTDATTQTQAALVTMFGPEEGRRIQESIIKELDLAGALDAPVSESKQLLNALTAAQLTFGADFNQKTYLAALRTSQAATRLTADAMVNFASVVDEQGQRAGSRLQRFNKILTSAGGEGSGVNATQIGLLEASGIREAARRNAELLETDFGEFIRQEVAPILERQGVSLDDAVAVKRGLQELGFTSQELALVEAEILKRRERQRDRERARQVRFDRFQENARKDIGLALKALAAQFDDVAVSVLKPFSELLAPAVIDVAKGFDDLARGDFTKEAIRSLASGAALGLGAFAINNPDVAALAGAGLRLNGSASRLNAAAAALTRAAGADAAGDMLDGPNGRGRGRGRNSAVNSFVNSAGRGARRGVGGGIAGAAIAGGVELATGGSLQNAAGAAAGAFVGGLTGTIFGPAGTVIGATIGAEIGRNHGDAVLAAFQQAGTYITDAVTSAIEAAKNDPLTKDVLVPGAKSVVSETAGFIADYLDNRDKQAEQRDRLIRINAADIRVDQLTDRLDRNAPHAFTSSEESMIKAFKLDTADRVAVQRTSEIINALTTPPAAQPTGSALDLMSLSDSAIFESGARAFEQTFMTGADSVSVAGDQAGAAITAGGAAAGQSIVAAGPTLAAALQNALIAGGQAAASAIQAAGANIRVNVSQPGPNTGTTAAPIE